MGEEVAGLPEDPAVDGAAEPRRDGPDGPPAAPPSGGAAPPGPGAEPPSETVEAEPIGAYLSRQRRLRGISLEELARITCIPRRSLERLEAGAFDATPDGFARGFVRTVATALGLDPDDAVARMLPEVRPGARRRPAPFPEPSPWFGGVLVALAVAAVAVLLVEVTSGPRDAAEIQAQRVFRRDAVRELARSEGLIPARGATGPASRAAAPMPSRAASPAADPAAAPPEAALDPDVPSAPAETPPAPAETPPAPAETPPAPAETPPAPAAAPAANTEAPAAP